jgi:peptidoglycan DL-endopeptidase CwlO
MKPGDLVYFDTYKIEGHVGIYMGTGNSLEHKSIQDDH